MASLALGCPQPVEQPKLGDEWHECVMSFMELFANENVKVAKATGRSLGRDGISREKGTETNTARDAIMVRKSDLEFIAKVCSASEDQIHRWAEAQAKCAESAECKQ